MGTIVSWAVPPHVVAADRKLVEAFDATIREGERRAGTHVTCRLGCTKCCIGPFDITALDAARLARGLELLARDAAETARAIRSRAGEQWRLMAAAFPGDARSGRLDFDDERRVELFARFGEVPCPVLDPTTGACLLYAWRPLSCRSFGLPVRCGGETLPPCPLNFTTASAEEIAEAVVEPDPEDHEGLLLAGGERCANPGAETVICAVLAASHGEDAGGNAVSGPL